MSTNATVRRDYTPGVSMPVQLEVPEYPFWQDVGNRLGLLTQIAVGAYLCGAPKITRENGKPLDQWERDMILALARARGLVILDEAF